MSALYWIFIIFFFMLCVVIHEFGHLIIAIKTGLKPECFSVGFGPVLFRFNYKGIEYRLSLLPFGGYVSLPQLEPTDTPMTSDGKPLPIASPSSRLWTAFAGPVANIFLGFFLAFFVMIIGTERIASQDQYFVSNIQQYVEPDANEIGLKSSDKIISINGKYVADWSTFWKSLTEKDVEAANGEFKVIVERSKLMSKETEQVELKVTPKTNPEYAVGLRSGYAIREINGQKFTYTPEEFLTSFALGNGNITLTVFDGKATKTLAPYEPIANVAKGGLFIPHFDIIPNLTIINAKDGQKVVVDKNKTIFDIASIIVKNKENVEQVEEIITQENIQRILKENFDSTITLVVRDTDKKSHKINATPSIRYVVGIYLEEKTNDVISVSPKSTADISGIVAGDKIVSINNTPISGRDSLVKAIQVCATNSFDAVIIRDNKSIAIKCPPPQATYSLNGYEFSYATDKYHPSPWSQFTKTVGTTVKTIKALINKKVKASDFSGPVGILQVSFIKMKQESFVGGLSFIVLISFSLAIFNLLPLPVLDGGHITFAVIEMIIRRRIPVKILVFTQTAFAFALISFAIFVTWHDVRRVISINGLSKKLDKVESIERKPKEIINSDTNPKKEESK